MGIKLISNLRMRADSLEAIIKMVADKEWEKQKKEYKKIIAENGNDNNHNH